MAWLSAISPLSTGTTPQKGFARLGNRAHCLSCDRGASTPAFPREARRTGSRSPLAGDDAKVKVQTVRSPQGDRTRGPERSDRTSRQEAPEEADQVSRAAGRIDRFTRKSKQDVQGGGGKRDGSKKGRGDDRRGSCQAETQGRTGFLKPKPTPKRLRPARATSKG